MADVVTLGILVADVLARPVDEWPERGLLVTVPEMTLHIGGCAANTGIGLAKMGVDTAVVGKVGNDGFGDFVINFLKKSGIDTRGVRRDPQASTSATMVMVHSDGERSFIHHIGANATLRPEEIDFEVISGAKLLHIAGCFLMPGFDGEPAAEVLRRAKELGVTTSLDTAWDATGRWAEIVDPMLPHVDYFMPSVEEARMIAGREDPREVAEVLLDKGVGTVALKMGGEGAYVRNGEVEFSVPIFAVEAVDATGAGDAFAAGFICGLVHGWDLERATRLGNAAGALCVTAMGTTSGLRSLEETVRFMESHGA